MACFVYEAMILFGLGLIPGVVGALAMATLGRDHPEPAEIAVRSFTFIFYGLYFVWFWARRGQTLPMQTWHIRLETRDGEGLRTPRAIARYLASWLWIAPPALLGTALRWSPWISLGARRRVDPALRSPEPAASAAPVLARRAVRHATRRRRPSAPSALMQRSAQTASSLVSPVRMRTTCSTPVTKILPSPILPVLAALTIASMQRSTSVSAHHHLDLHLRQEIDHVLRAAVQLGVPLLTAESLDLGDRQPRHAHLRQRFAHFLELEGLDDGGDLLHGESERVCTGPV